MLITTTGLVAVQLLPFLELLRHSQRGAEFGTGEWTLSWSGLGNFLVPLFGTFRDRDGVYFQQAQQWITSFYGGITIVLFALVGMWTARNRRVRLLIVVTLVSIALALGSHGFIYEWFRKAVPGLGLMRYPIKFIVPAVVALPLLAAFGARHWAERPGAKRLCLAFALLLAICSAVLLAISQAHPAHREVSNSTLWSGLTSVAWLALITFLLTTAQTAAAFSVRWLPPVTLALIVYADLFFANRHINPTAHATALKMNVAVIEPRPHLGKARAMVATAAHERLDTTYFTTPEAAVQLPRSALLLNANLLESVPKLDGFFSLYLPAPATLIARLGAEPTNSTSQGLLDFLCVSHVSLPDKPWAWARRTNFLPLLALVPRALAFDLTKKNEQLFSEQFNPREAFFPAPQTNQRVGAAGEGRGTILSSRIGTHRIEAVVEADHSMIMTVAQADYPGWRATLDDQPVPLRTANGAFQAIEVPAGRHEVKVYFRCVTFEIGAAITIVALIACWAILRKPRLT
jgi:hypothetical protein